MTGRTRLWVWAVAAVCGLASAGLVALVLIADLDTAGQVAGIAGSVAGLAGLAVSVYALHRSPGAGGGGAAGNTGGSTAPVTGARSVTAGGSIGRAVTGDNNQVPGTAPAPANPPPTASGSGSAGGTTAGPTGAPPVPGERAVTAGGDIGEAVTGDGNTLT